MATDEDIEWIKKRILAEHRKYFSTRIDWAEMAARKIVSSLEKCENKKTKKVDINETSPKHNY